MSKKEYECEECGLIIIDRDRSEDGTITLSPTECPRCRIALVRKGAVEEIRLDDGKYTFYKRGPALFCKRYGEEWRDFVFDKAVTALCDYALSLERRE